MMASISVGSRAEGTHTKSVSRRSTDRVSTFQELQAFCVQLYTTTVADHMQQLAHMDTVVHVELATTSSTLLYYMTRICMRADF